jgi:photosystem II stability/assembly factor-like uncharacterized protein
MAIGVSPNGKNHYESTAPTDELLVATLHGIVRLERASGTWREAGRKCEGQHFGAIAIEPTRGVIFAGAHKGGFWVSEDNGQTWERRTNGMASEDVYGVNCVQAGDELRVYAGTEPAHLHVSTDLGQSWTELRSLLEVPSRASWTFPAPPNEGHVKNIVFDPSDPNTIYVGVEVGGAFKSTDAGQTWTELSGFYEDVHRLMTVATRPNDVYMSTGRNLYHSVDKGSSWKIMPLPENRIKYPDALVILPQQPEIMFTAGASDTPGRQWAASHDANAAIARTRDAGRSWEYLAGGLPSHIRGNVEGMTMNVFPGGFELFAATTDGDVFYSQDEGESWTTIAQGLPPISKGGHYRALRPDLAPAAH